MNLRCLLILVLALGGCTSLPPLPWAQKVPDTTEPLELISAGLLATRQRQGQLAVALRNRSNQLLWTSVRFTSPAGNDGCLGVKELAPGAEGLFTCTAQRLTPGDLYLVTIRAYDDLAQTRQVAELATELRLGEEELEFLAP